MAIGRSTQTIFKYFKKSQETQSSQSDNVDRVDSERPEQSDATACAVSGHDITSPITNSGQAGKCGEEIESLGSSVSERVLEKKNSETLLAEGREHIFKTFSATFEDTCDRCSRLSDDHLRSKRGQNKETKFLHDWLTSPKTSFDKNTGLWWLVYIKNVGMYCSLCKKHDTLNPRNKSKTWNVTPLVRLRKIAILEHVETEQHKSAINKEMLQRVSVFQKEINMKNKMNKTVLEKTFHAIYWLAKQEISKNLSLSLNLLSR